EPDAGVSRLHRDLVSAVEEHQRTVSRVLGPARRGWAHLFHWDGQRLRGVAERAGALEHIGERVRGRLDGQRLAPAGWDPHVEIARIRGDAVRRTGLSPEAPTDDPNRGAVVIHHFGDVTRRDVLVAGSGHLQGRGEVRPQLESVTT